MKVLVTYDLSETELAGLSKEIVEHLIRYGTFETRVHGSSDNSPFWNEDEQFANNPILTNPIDISFREEN